MLRSYLKFAWRNLRKSFSYSLINIAGLALGIASVLLIFLYIQHEFSFDNYHEKGERIYRITSYAGFNEKEWRAGTPGDPIPEFRNNDESVLEGVRITRCLGGGDFTVRGEEYTGFKPGCTESSLFNIFSFPLVSRSREDVLKSPFTAVISQSVARRVFGEENPLGKTLETNWGLRGGTETFEITGVMEDIPANTHFHHEIYYSYSSLEGTGLCMDCGGQQQYLMLAEGADTAALSDNIGSHVREIDGKSYVEEIRLEPLKEIHFSSIRAERQGDWQYIKILTAIAVVILIIGCGNYMNMATARYSKRAREIGIRKVMGAYRSQLARQFLTETMLLSVMALPIALTLVYLAIPWFNIYAGTGITLSMIGDPLFYLAAIGLLLFTGLLAGSYPALFISAFRPREVLQGGRTVGPGSAGVRKGLVTFQFLASLVMIGITALILQQLNFVQQKNLGFDSDKVVSITITDPVFQGQPQTVADAFKGLASVQTATVSRAPGTGGMASMSMSFQQDTSSDTKYTFATPRIDSEFLETFQIDLVAGRNITAPSSERGGRIVEGMLNETGLRELGYQRPDEVLNEIVGNRYRIVGVVEDFHLSSLRSQIQPAILERNAYGRALMVNVRLSGGNISRGLVDLRSVWEEELSTSEPFTYNFVDDQLQKQYENERRTAKVIGVFAGLSILIACMGLFGMASFTAQQRMKEIGIRKVMGAGVASIILLLYKDFGKLIALATVISVPVIYYAGQRWLENFAYRIDIGPLAFLLAVLGVSLVTVIATGARSLRAALMNPVDSIRQE